jgi:hypothetical protein
MALDAERDELEPADWEGFAASSTLLLTINWVATEEKAAVFILYSQSMADVDV